MYFVTIARSLSTYKSCTIIRYVELGGGVLNTNLKKNHTHDIRPFVVIVLISEENI